MNHISKTRSFSRYFHTSISRRFSLVFMLLTGISLMFLFFKASRPMGDDVESRLTLKNLPLKMHTQSGYNNNGSELLFSENTLWFQKKLSSYSKNIARHSETTNITKKILFWNKDFGGGLSPFGSAAGSDWFRSIGCPVWRCEVSGRGRGRENNSNLALPVEEYDAIFFHDPTWFNMSLPAKRSPRQLYVWYNWEAPGFHSYLKKWDDSASLFNLTWTYRWDSDIAAPYGSFRSITDDENLSRQVGDQTTNNYAEGKTKMAVWFVSNCEAKNGRLDYVHHLQRHISVDIYGKCGTLKCPHAKQGECREMMQHDYKFVIAFENSMCLDYITEKFFYNLSFNIVPVVLDLNGNYNKMAPPRSFINALDYPTVKDLADYLKVLDRNDTLYNEYFRWKRLYALGGPNAACQLCFKLHDPSNPVSVKRDLAKWWHYEASCKVLTFDKDNDTWIAGDFNPPYDGQWPHGPDHWVTVANY